VMRCWPNGSILGVRDSTGAGFGIKAGHELYGEWMREEIDGWEVDLGWTASRTLNTGPELRLWTAETNLKVLQRLCKILRLEDVNSAAQRLDSLVPG